MPSEKGKAESGTYHNQNMSMQRPDEKGKREPEHLHNRHTFIHRRNKKEIDKQELGLYWRFQSGQMWSRIQTASFVEAGVLTAWYTVYGQKLYTLGLLILLIGVVILIVVGLLMRRDSQYMQACEKRLGQNFPQAEKPFLGISGRFIAVGLPLFLGIIDIVLAIIQQIL